MCPCQRSKWRLIIRPRVPSTRIDEADDMGDEMPQSDWNKCESCVANEGVGINTGTGE